MIEIVTSVIAYYGSGSEELGAHSKDMFICGPQISMFNVLMNFCIGNLFLAHGL